MFGFQPPTPVLGAFLSRKNQGENICQRATSERMAFVTSSCSCRSAFSFSSALKSRFPLVGAYCVLSLSLTHLSAISSPSIFKTGCAQSHPFLPFLRKLNIQRKGKGKKQEEEKEMPSFQHPRTMRRVSLLVLIMMMTTTWSFLTAMSKFRSQSSAKAIHSTGMEGSTSTVPSIVVYVTVPNKEAGKKLAESIIGEKLAACVNRVPGIESVYFWEGKVQTDSEELLIIKTRESLLQALTEHVKANHEYELPEVIAMPITGGNLKYLEWIKESTRD